MTRSPPATHPSDDWGVEVWRGGVAAWECDEMGHLNVRFYVAKAMEGLAGLAAALGLKQAFSPRANATLIVRDLHIRFLREAHVGAPMHMRGAVLEMGAQEARLLLTLFHSDSGEPAAAFQVQVDHATPVNGQAFAWGAKTRDLAAALTIKAPVYAEARGIGAGPVISQASVARAEALGLTPIGTGVVMAQDCDVFGRMRADHFMGRIAEGVSRIARETRRQVIEGLTEVPARVGGVALEYRLAYLRWPRADDRIVLRSGLAGVDASTQRLVHWMLDPETGAPWAVSEAVAAIFDLDARKILPASPQAMAGLQSLVVDGLTL
jgi:acyl-CoA thioester hydrolase